jgi:predicted TIM-barrel fold metal-dependent hydrolase
MIIDIHAHAFPDAIAERALKALTENSGEYKPFIAGTTEALSDSMKKAGIDRACVANIATKPGQTRKILEWSAGIKSERLIPLGSVHPESETWESDIEDIAVSGAPGVKFHPLYQKFNIDDTRMYPKYEKLAEKGLFALFHAGYDVSFGDDDNAHPGRIARVRADIPGLVIIAAHLGGWRDWERAFDEIAGKDVFLDTSFIQEVPPSVRNKILSRHSAERVVFGTDSPWLPQPSCVAEIEHLAISSDAKEKIFSGNYMRYLA